MIIGGVSGAGKTASMRTGYSMAFLPVQVFVVPAPVRAAFSPGSGAAIQYTARARVRDVPNMSWVDLPTVSYFQITRKSDGYDTADVTAQLPEIWSPFLPGGPWEDLLRPSTRAFQIFSGIVIAGIHYELPVFIGKIETVSEPHGPSGGALNLRLIDIRKQFTRLPAEQHIGSQTVYRNILRQMRVVQAIGGGWAPFQANIELTLKDQTFSATVSPGQNVLDAILASVPGIPAVQPRSSGALTVGSASDETPDETSFDFSDRNVFGLTRFFQNSGTYNTVRCIGLVLGVPTTSEVSDVADVAKRGRIVYAGGFVGSPTIELVQAEEEALRGIAYALRGKLRGSVRYNPLLEPGIWVGLESARLGVPPSRASVRAIRHQYSIGRCRTYLEEIAAVAI